VPLLTISPFVGCSIGLLHRKVPVVGVIAQPFFNRIVSESTKVRLWVLTAQLSARLGGGAFMNRTIKLPLTGGIPQPLNSLADCIFSAECEFVHR
jgi:myo-inositol-1(or 4)-monophosphatase